MSYKKSFEQRNHFGRNKKKSDDFLKKRAEEKINRPPVLPKHALLEPELADKSFKLPKIPLKHDVSIPSVQLSIAEIIEESDRSLQEKEREDTEDSIEIVQETGSIIPVLTQEELILANSKFAEKQKVSIISLIKLIVPKLDNKIVIIPLTRQQEEFIGDIKIEWQAFLRTYFKDRAITLQFMIDDKLETKKVAYTASEQFKEMMDSNDQFRKMVNMFKLKLKQ